VRDTPRNTAGTAQGRSCRRQRRRCGAVVFAFAIQFIGLLLSCGVVHAQSIPPLVFVERQIPADGNAHWPTKALPGVGAYARLRPAAPARLRVRDSDGTLRTLLDGGMGGAADGPPEDPPGDA
jgi:hypothetical protein